MNLDTPIESLPLVGNAYVEKFKNLDIRSIGDLLYHLPSRFEDTSIISKISEIENVQGRLWTVKGQVTEIETIYTRYGKRITRGIIEDDSGVAELIWFNQPYLSNSIPKYRDLLISGRVSFEDYLKPKFVSPSYEIIKDGKNGVHLGKLTPIYPETKGISSKWLRARIDAALKLVSIEDWLPSNFTGRYNLEDLKKALNNIHNPNTIDDFLSSKHRIAFDEMLLVQFLMKKKRELQRNESAARISIPPEDKEIFISSLPFDLTESQLACIEDIFNDIKNPVPMNRLLEGEVGSGKTVVAAAALFASYKSKVKSAMMAPTSILAKQHFDSISKLLMNAGIPENEITLATGKHKPNLEASIYIGTQALLFSEGIINAISLCVIDEQHRFGVHQREKLVNGNGLTIHSLTMTATPIPRTLALSIYGDLDISYIKHLPKGRKPIKTNIVPSKKRNDMYNFLKERVKNGEQAFIICPLVSLSDKLNLKSAEEEFVRLQRDVFPEFKLALLHGQMKPNEKDLILESFKNKDFEILVATPVVEVGIDIPNASVILIEGAERFGLAQLHQLRGRVGRGEHQSYCFLATTEISHEDKERLRVFAGTSSGLELAEYDLKSRGPGEVYGIRQSGVPMLKAASLLDVELINETKIAADDIIKERIDQTPEFQKELKKFLDNISNKN